ncbi:MFS transporter, partial [Amycolatopsis mediterranei]
MSSRAVAARPLRRVAVASAVGTTIEWYDYFIYSTATALVFGKLFFTTLSPASGTLAAFATLGVGFLARPVGGILWGHFGDRVGRKAMLVLSLLLMGVATVGVGLLPTYSAIGVWAPVLLLVLRLLQGLSAGGEWGG